MSDRTVASVGNCHMILMVVPYMSYHYNTVTITDISIGKLAGENRKKDRHSRWVHIRMKGRKMNIFSDTKASLPSYSLNNTNNPWGR